MAKGIVLGYRDVDPGSAANDIALYADVVIVGTEAEIPGRVVSLERVPIAIAINQLAQYANNVEDALLAAAAALSPPVTLARTDCLFPDYVRGA